MRKLGLLALAIFAGLSVTGCPQQPVKPTVDPKLERMKRLEYESVKKLEAKRAAEKRAAKGKAAE
jgi:hypothetical protein